MKPAPLMTRWAVLGDTNAPLPEYPRLQLVRTNWLNSNGLWQFQPGAANDPAPAGQTLSNQILVPYPMESALSGVMHYYEYSWYRRKVHRACRVEGQKNHPAPGCGGLAGIGRRWFTFNGQKVGVHKGGYDPFGYGITPYLNGGTNELIVNVYNPEDNGSQPRGKQTLKPWLLMY